MSVLVKSDILKQIQERHIVVSPILAEEQVGASSVDLRLGTVFLMVRARGLSHVEPSQFKRSGNPDNDHTWELARKQKHERNEVPFERGFLLHPGMLALVPTLEWVKLPPNIQGIVTARSSWAREGLSIATATIINPGYKGVITFELANLGEIPIRLYPGLRIAQIAFHQLSGAALKKDLTSQFDMAFEPIEGDIVRGDEPFLPPDKPTI